MGGGGEHFIRKTKKDVAYNILLLKSQRKRTKSIYEEIVKEEKAKPAG